MKAITFEEFGAAEVLQLADVPAPEVRPDDLLVRVHAAGVNRADLTHRRGGYGRPNFGDSTIMGLEIAGEVIETGGAVQGYKVGDRVMGVVGGGAYAEVARIDWRMAMPIPAALDYVHAAAIPEVFVTAHEALIHLGRLQRGDSVLIHAAAGGVGSAAVQLAYATGATVFATAEGSKLERVVQLGADHAIDYKTQDFAEVVAGKTDKRGVDVVIDFVGAPYFARNVASLANGGRLVQVGILGGGGDVSVGLEQILYRHLQIIGTVMKSRAQTEKHAMVRRFREHWLERFAGGASLEPVVDSTFALENAADAHRRMESAANVGKIILTMRERT
ncbi:MULTISPECIES: NAD(P)H-quinone oxidoreductase [Paraburkholderia]|jgi:putative PIG3 family NAD(P)H quinone oxidoreductase|uniref:Quinone oxidoreductase n=1 Tax=Paraburkholderia caribensis TaxID=75105 RepID=A0A9Q6S6S3_9BURK|nr:MULTISPECIES: NAD(P)H-quinone oxidoreductase [Paraburkholderia]ALP64885.1 quinone oxidoreductase [Paraburkholderia caribensis]AUT53966.1 quinone oxidoreductase [Paraburkholderia caribensis]MCO4876893.1 NAD(P)H-quinone oxidoreductase [Paraburkholderia caribensis]PTB30748.1 NAD(P)H-quinone oxidoreductase [Paraburkholderia caribensis]QLB65649.1 quinone oxidoreductase [Paraburkholderia caribensis]